jgi:hypothetical protein
VGVSQPADARVLSSTPAGAGKPIRRVVVGRRGLNNGIARPPPLICDPDAPRFLGAMADRPTRQANRWGGLVMDDLSEASGHLYWFQPTYDFSRGAVGFLPRVRNADSAEWTWLARGSCEDLTYTSRVPVAVRPTSGGRLAVVTGRACYEFDPAHGTARPMRFQPVTITATPGDVNPRKPNPLHFPEFITSVFYGNLMVVGDDVYQFRIAADP